MIGIAVLAHDAGLIYGAPIYQQFAVFLGIVVCGHVIDAIRR